MPIVSIRLDVILALWPPVLQQQLCFSFVFCSFFVFVVRSCFLSGGPKQNQGRGLVDLKLVQAPQ